MALDSTQSFPRAAAVSLRPMVRISVSSKSSTSVFFPPRFLPPVSVAWRAAELKDISLAGESPQPVQGQVLAVRSSDSQSFSGSGQSRPPSSHDSAGSLQNVTLLWSPREIKGSQEARGRRRSKKRDWHLPRGKPGHCVER